MSKPYDATTRFLLESFPGDWPDYLGTARGWPIRVINADLSTITSEADKVFLVEAPEPWLLHVELQSGHDREIPRRLLRYNVLLDGRHDLPVESVLVLLRPGADGPALSGAYRRELPGQGPHLEFRYKVVRAWQQPVEAILEGGIGTLPLAPISAVAPEALPGVIRRMEERLDREVSEADAGMLWTATFLLMGLRYEPGFSNLLLREVRAMKESTTYQAILEEGEARGKAEGRVEEARRMLLRIGRKRLGEPSEGVRAAIESIVEQERAEILGERLLDVVSWDELLSPPDPTTTGLTVDERRTGPTGGRTA